MAGTTLASRGADGSTGPAPTTATEQLLLLLTPAMLAERRRFIIFVFFRNIIANLSGLVVVYFTLKGGKVVIAEIIFCFYLLSNVVVPEDMLAVDIGTPPIIISVVIFIGIVLKLPAGEISS